MNQYSLTPEARKDIKEITDFIGKNNREAARRFLTLLTEKFQVLSTFPEMGRSWNNLVPPLKSFPFNDYLIFYRLSKKGIQIIRVISGYRNLEAIFTKRSN